MPTFTYSLASSVAASIPEPIDQRSRFFGRDIWFKNGDYFVTPSGDWLIAEGREALKQAVMRRLLTSPGEWATLPDYGVGVRDYIKAKNTPGARADLVNRIQSQLLKEPRVARVREVIIDTEAVPNGLKVSVKFDARGEIRRNTPEIVTVEVN